MEEKIRLAKELGVLQFERLGKGEGSASMISFVDEYGMRIVNPWMDNTGRFEFSDEQAVKAYGLENVLKFIEEASSKHLDYYRS